MAHRTLEAIVNDQVQRWRLEIARARQMRQAACGRLPVITISRTLGSGGNDIARRVAERMGCQMFYGEVLDRIAESAEVRRSVVEALDESGRTRLEQWIEGMLEQQIFDLDDYYHHLVQVVLTLAEPGNVVFLGRGANYILQDQLTLNVRLIASFEIRVERIRARENLTREQAEKRVRKSDSDRTRFIRRLFRQEWADPEAYHLVINTAELDVESCAVLIECAWKRLCENAGIGSAKEK